MASSSSYTFSSWVATAQPCLIIASSREPNIDEVREGHRGPNEKNLSRNCVIQRDPSGLAGTQSRSLDRLFRAFERLKLAFASAYCSTQLAV